MYGKPLDWPKGRFIGSLPLRLVILEARNQTEHWELKDPRDGIVKCFESLACEVDPVFMNYKTKNMAFEVVPLLGWRT